MKKEVHGKVQFWNYVNENSKMVKKNVQRNLWSVFFFTNYEIEIKI